MPNFKEFIKGFEEKPEAEQLKPAPKSDGFGGVTKEPNKSPLAHTSEELKKMEAQRNAPKTYVQQETKPQPKEEPKPSNYRQWRSNPENAKREKEADAKYKPMYDELDKKDDELYKAYYYEQDPKKKAELKAQMDENDKKINALLDEWGKATGYPETPEEKRAWASLENMSQPKEGSFEQVFNDMSKPEQGLGDFNPSERIEDYQSGAKTHSENEFRLEALNDRGMYDFISKNRDYLYRKANSDPEGAIKDIIRHGQNNYGIKPENIRKDYVMEVLKEFYEDDEGAIPDFTKQEEFKPSEKIEEFNDYYGAKTNSERNLNLLTGNDRGAYEYISQNRDALAKEAEYDPASVLNKIKWHANQRDWARSLKGDSIRKDYLINVIKGIVED